eukprot:TRINITY_DN2580_c0_g1_i12.p1 TRINITY_DN2580_c0_g1~~TRINITY_DN2580_c0_g1_i12.p1  ORF type:complete len:120 (+),score=13.82 TRINITY_DN2580_c0_g1_i12:183-542(+)
MINITEKQVKKLIAALLNDETVYDFRLSIRDTILKIMEIKLGDTFVTDDWYFKQTAYNTHSRVLNQKRTLMPQMSLFEGIHGKSIGKTAADTGQVDRKNLKHRKAQVSFSISVVNNHAD